MSPAAGASKTVLIADDTAFVRERFKAAVEEAGHRAITVRTAAELLARIRSDLERLDLLLLDLRLPNTSGPELVRAVRKLDEGRLPIVVFSGTIASAAPPAGSFRHITGGFLRRPRLRPFGACRYNSKAAEETPFAPTRRSRLRPERRGPS